MKLSGMTNNSEHRLNVAILQVARKQKITGEVFWIQASRHHDSQPVNSLDDMTIAERVDWLIDLGWEMYKR